MGLGRHADTAPHREGVNNANAPHDLLDEVVRAAAGVGDGSQDSKQCCNGRLMLQHLVDVSKEFPQPQSLPVTTSQYQLNAWQMRALCFAEMAR